MDIRLRPSLISVPLAALFLLTGCADSDPELTVADVEGSWSAVGGGHLTVRADGTADLDRVTRPGPDCGRSTGAAGRTYTGPATWVFDTYPDEKSGIRFDYQGPATAKPCKIYLVVFPLKDGAKGFLPQDPSDVSYVRSAGRQG
ncbi:hypothetical protein [Streptomyces sp. NPDC090131]|uniref:hypothetical protein n=1 Tax=Streptomyces sp. NPDC090131 TaxID=3365954 RepID=UPI003825E67F